MAFLLILIGAILIVTALHSTMGDLATALETDIPGFFAWALAIGAILALGYVPALRTPSRALLVLVALVIVLTQWTKLAAGLQSFKSAVSSSPQGQAQPDPTQAYATTGSPAVPTQAQITGTSGGAAGTPGAPSSTAVAALTPGQSLSPASALASFDPSGFLSSFTRSIGFGGLGS